MPDAKAPFYEPFIQRHFPGVAARRAAARAETERQGALRDTYATHRGGIQSRTATPWGSGKWSYVGGTLTERHSFADMRDRGREVYANNPFAASLVDTETSNVVSSGFTCDPKTSLAEFNKEAQKKFYDFFESADLMGLRKYADFQQFVWKQTRIDGDGGVLLVDRFGQSKLQYVPADRIKTPPDRITTREGQNEVIDGVEVDATNRPVAFHIAVLDSNGKETFERVLADNFIYLAHPDNSVPLAVRGMSCYGRIFGLLDQLDGYVDAVVKAARAIAAISILFKVSNPAKTQQGFPNGTDGKGETRKVFYEEHGVYKIIGKEDEVAQPMAQQPMTQTPDFIRALFKYICLAFRMPLEIGARDLSQVNFSGGRIGLIQYYRVCREWQDWFISHFLSRVYRWWISREVKRGRFVAVVPEDFWAHEFRGDQWAYNDPETEIKAKLLAIAGGLDSVQGACADLGTNWKQIQVDQKEFKEFREDELGLPPVDKSSGTRDATTKVTAVDADGNPIANGPDGAPPLNGIQITSAIDVLTKVTEKLVEPATAIELISRLNIAPDKAKAMVAAAANRQGISTSDREFQREILKTLLTVPAAREAVYNATDIEDLIAQSGLPPEKAEDGQPLTVPFIPVIAPAGQLVSGEVIEDMEGDFVGGDVEHNLPEETMEESPRLPTNEPAPPAPPEPPVEE
jgi:capsid protein